MSETDNTTPETPAAPVAAAPTQPVTAPTPSNVIPLPSAETATPAAPEEERPVLTSRLVHVIGAFLSQHLDKAEKDVSEELNHLFALYSQHALLVTAINGDVELVKKVIAAVDAEIHRVTEEIGIQRKEAPAVSEPSNIIVPNIHS